MDEERLVERLGDLGLTEYQSRAYVAAVSLGSGRPGELAEAADVPQARIYDVVDDLEELGLVEVQARSGGKVVSAPRPEVVLEEFKQRRMDEFASTVQSAMSGLSRRYQRDRDTEGFVSMVRLEESARRHIRRAVADADWWLTLSLSPATYRAVADEVAAAADRGVTVRLLVRSGGDEPGGRGGQADGDEPGVRSGGADGDDLTLEPEPPASVRVRHREIADTLAVADRSYGVFSSRHPNADSQPYIVTQEKNLVLLFQNYCEQIWHTSAPVRAGDGVPRWYLDPWRLIVDAGDALADGDWRVRVVGYRADEDRDGEWTGRLVDHDLRGPVEGDYASSLPVAASLTVDVGDERLRVGGWKATVEDVAAAAIRLDRD